MVQPEHFPLAYDPWMMSFATENPQMLHMQRLLHGDAGPIRVDHTIMLNRPKGATGRTWHSHLHGPGDTSEGDFGGVDVTEGTGLKLVRTLCFPDGIDGERVGGLVGMIPGAHTYKDPWERPRLFSSGPPDTGTTAAVIDYSTSPRSVL